MDVYDDLQDPQKQLVLTNIRQFHEEEQEDRLKTARERYKRKQSELESH